MTDKYALLNTITPYPTGYYSQQCQCTRADMDRIIAQNAQQSVNTSFIAQSAPQLVNTSLLAAMPNPYNNATPRRRRTGNCARCGAPVDPYKEKCDYCDCYYD